MISVLTLLSSGRDFWFESESQSISNDENYKKLRNILTTQNK